MQANQIRLREFFLTEFVKSLINNSLTNEEKEQIKKQAQRNQALMQKINQEIQSPKQFNEEQMIPSMMHSLEQAAPRVIPQIKHTAYQPQPSREQSKQSFNLGKLAKLLLDPAVLSVESPGPGKNILVNRSGKIQTSGITLSQEEIRNVINEISEKTRVPVSPGVFKAAFQDLIITAVLSEHVGARFIIQKRRLY